MMFLTQSAPDRNGFEYLAKIDPEWLEAAFWCAILFCAYHAFRRADNDSPSPRPKANYILNQRLYHWGNFLLLGLLAVSGLALYYRRFAVASIFGFDWLTIHEWCGGLFILGVVVHAVSARFRGDWNSMRPRMKDWHDLRAKWRSFPAQSTEEPQRYNSAQKNYHHLLALLAILFTASGVLMW